MTQSYSKERADKLLVIANKLNTWLNDYKNLSYIDKMALLTVISINYLNMLHSFKVNNDLWRKAKKDINFILKNVKDINHIDTCFQLIKDNIDKYIITLENKWINKNE